MQRWVALSCAGRACPGRAPAECSRHSLAADGLQRGRALGGRRPALRDGRRRRGPLARRAGPSPRRRRLSHVPFCGDAAVVAGVWRCRRPGGGEWAGLGLSQVPPTPWTRPRCVWLRPHHPGGKEAAGRLRRLCPIRPFPLLTALRPSRRRRGWVVGRVAVPWLRRCCDDWPWRRPAGRSASSGLRRGSHASSFAKWTLVPCACACCAGSKARAPCNPQSWLKRGSPFEVKSGAVFAAHTPCGRPTRLLRQAWSKLH